MGNRIYYAIQQVGIKPASVGTGGSFIAIHGIQNVGMSTSFTNSQVPTLGKLSIFDTLEDGYEIQVNLKKVLDGYPLIYTSTTSDCIYPTLQNRIFYQSTFGMSIFDDNTSYFATGTPLAVVQCSGLYISSLKYNFDVGSNFEEEVTLVGDNKIWSNDWKIVSLDIGIRNSLLAAFPGQFNNLDSPIGTGGVNRRWDMTFGSSVDNTTIPTDIPPGSHISNITVSANINREALPQLGNKSPFFRLPTFPVETTTEIGITAISGDVISATDSGILTTSPCCADFGNLNDQLIRIATHEGTRIYLGSKNKLSSINYQGGDTAGGNVKVSYTYKGYNDFTVLHPTESKGFWEDRDIWLSNTDDTDILYGISNFGVGYNQGITAIDNNVIDLNSTGIQLYKYSWNNNITTPERVVFNWSGTFSDITITGMILEARPSILDGVSYNTTLSPFIPTWTGTWKSQVEPGVYLFNVLEDNNGILTTNSSGILFPSGYSVDSILDTQYQYRLRGIYNNGLSTIPSNICTLDIKTEIITNFSFGINQDITTPNGQLLDLQQLYMSLGI